MAAVRAQSVRGFSAADVPAEDSYNRCVRCGLCLPACPTYAETLIETSGPRGRIALIKAVGDGTLDLLSPGFVHQMSECLDCRACEATCPSGVRYGALLERARTQVRVAVAEREHALTRLLHRASVRWLFGNLRLLRMLARVLRFAQRSGLERLARSTGLLRAFGLERAASLLPRISSGFFVARDQRLRALTLESREVVFLHAGCVMQVAFADVDEATARVLQRAACDVVVPAGQGCCGALAAHAGDLEFARTLARRNIAAFEASGAGVYVVNAAGCGAALKKYGELLAEDAAWAERAAAFSLNVRDVTEFLDDAGIAPELGPLDAVVSYQEPCHLAHAQRISAAPRRLLALIPGLVLREMKESALCCGSAGAYNLTQPEMSHRLGERKTRNILAAEPNVVATANPGCAIQLAAALRAAGRPIPVKHVVQLLDESYDAYNPTSGASSAKASSRL